MSLRFYALLKKKTCSQSKRHAAIGRSCPGFLQLSSISVRSLLCVNCVHLSEMTGRGWRVQSGQQFTLQCWMPWLLLRFRWSTKKRRKRKKKSLQNKTPATDNGVGANHFLVSTACFKTAQMQQSRVLVRLMLCWLCCIFTPRQLIRSSPSAAPACERWLPRPCRRCSDPASVHSAYLRSLTDMY